MIVINTQYIENYGSSTNPYWKPKGGYTYKIVGAPLGQDLQSIVNAAAISYSNDYSQEYIINWTVESDDYLSEFEQNQLNNEGKITFLEPTIKFTDILGTIK